MMPWARTLGSDMRAIVLVATAAVLSSAAAQPRSPEPPPALDMTEIAPGVFVHVGEIELMRRNNEGAIANVGFVVGNDAVAVIDSGGSLREGRMLLAAVRSRTGKPIRYVINTHVHPDHVFGNAAFVGDDIEFVGHRNLPRALAERGSFYIETFRHEMGSDVMAGTRIVTPTLRVENETRLDLGGRIVVAKAWPVAHTDNDLTVLDESSGTLFAGDLIVSRHVPVLDGSLRGWLKVLDDLAGGSAVRVVPGHGPVLDDWQGAIASERRYLERLAADVRTLIARGAPIAEAKTAAQAEKPLWALFDEYNERNATAAYAELEWE
jgi:quinoprotein relay system zinc metallohydrolase 2